MQSPSPDIVRTAQAGLQALNAGRPAEARRLFEQVAASGQADASLFHGLALACREIKDLPAALAATEQSLALEPRSVGVHLLRADMLAEAGDVRLAAAAYDAAIRAAPSQGASPRLQAELLRAAEQSRRLTAQYEAHLTERLARAGAPSPRVAQSLDLLFGRTRLYLQEPTLYYLPGLPQRAFYEREEFSWAAALEGETDAIRAELLDVMRTEDAFAPYIAGEADRVIDDPHGLMNNPDWSAFYLVQGGRIVPENGARCPRTMAALSAVPLTDIPGRAPTVMFSRLTAGARIGAHNGFVNTRLICHLPLIVPDGCALRVGAETRPWRPGELLIFDDSIEHEAWNDSPDTRVVLLFDVWRPELTTQERAQVKALFEAVTDFGAGEGDWSS